jgi:hypothetical protein
MAISKIVAWICTCLFGPRLPGGLAGSSTAHKDVYERSTHLSHLFGYAIVGGLAAEFVVGCIWFRGWETGLGVAATFVISGGNYTVDPAYVEQRLKSETS